MPLLTLTAAPNCLATLVTAARAMATAPAINAATAINGRSKKGVLLLILRILKPPNNQRSNLNGLPKENAPTMPLQPAASRNRIVSQKVTLPAIRGAQ